MTDSPPGAKRGRHTRNERLNRLPLAAAANQPLAYLIRESGFRSLAAFATAINDYASLAYGIQLSHDHNIIRRWLNGATCMHPTIVADVLSDACGVTIPPAVLWPDERNGTPPVPAHLQPCIAEHTLANLGAFLRRDALRDSTWVDPIQTVTGDELMNPISRWLSSPPIRLPAAEQRPRRIDQVTVERIEAATTHFMAVDAAAGGAAVRDAAVGQLRYAVDLVSSHAQCDAPTRNRLLAAIAMLAGEVGWMAHDAGLDGIAQQYFVYALQAARAAEGERARLIVVRVLIHMAHQMCMLKSPQTALRLIDFANHYIRYIPHGAMQGMLWILKARALALLGPSRMNEISSAIILAFDADDNVSDEPSAQNEVFPCLDYAEMLRRAADAYLDIAVLDTDLATDLATKAESCSLSALAAQHEWLTRERVYNLANLAQSRFLLGKFDEACDDGTQAIQLGQQVTGSTRLAERLRGLEVIQRLILER